MLSKTVPQCPRTTCGTGISELLKLPIQHFLGHWAVSFCTSSNEEKHTSVLPLENIRPSNDNSWELHLRNSWNNRVVSEEILNRGPKYLFERILILKFPCKNIHRNWWTFFFFFYIQLGFSRLQHKSFNVTFATLERQTYLIQVSLNSNFTWIKNCR